jgi:glycosyltransferase involved in cell wall biosynthesis
MGMKICLYNVTSTMDEIGSSEVGGVEAYSFRLGEALVQRGHEVVLWGGQPKAAKRTQAANFACKVFPYVETKSIPQWGTRFRRLIQRLHFGVVTRRPFLESDYDVVFLFKPYDLIVAWLWRISGYSGRVVLSIHGPEFYAFDRTWIDQVDEIYAVSPSTAHRVKEHYGRACPVYPNFLDVDRFGMRTLEVKGLATREERNLVTVARLVKLKGVEYLIRAFAGIVPFDPNWNLVVIGDGPERSILEELANELGVSEKVRFTGILNEESLRRELGKAFLYVQPSIGYESFSISTLEAVSMGVRSLVSEQVEIGRWFQPCGSVTVFQSRNKEALMDAIQSVARESPDQYRAYTQAARELVEREFSSRGVVGRIEKLFTNPE